MAKYNFWVRTTKQTNHPMKGIEMEFGECLQMFNDYMTLLAEIGEENKPELQAALNELVEVGLIKRLAGGKGGCRYDVTFKPNVI